MTATNTKKLTLSIPHRLGEAEAASRLRAGVTDYRTRFGDKLAQVDDRWDPAGRRMDFRLGVMGQFVTGNVLVRPETVDLEVELPWILAMLAETIRGKVEQEGRKLLEAPPRTG